MICFNPKLKYQARMAALTRLIQHSYGSSSQQIKLRKGNKRQTDWNRRKKSVPVCRWQDFLPRKSQGIYLPPPPKNPLIISESVMGYKK